MSSKYRNGEKQADPSFPYHIPTGRVAACIESYIEKNVVRDANIRPGDRHGLSDVAWLCDFQPRQISSILDQQYRTVAFNTFEKLLIGLDLLHLLQEPPEEGGFADLYLCKTVQPALPPLTEKQAQTLERHNERRQELKAQRAEAA